MIYIELSDDYQVIDTVHGGLKYENGKYVFCPAEKVDGSTHSLREALESMEKEKTFRINLQG